MFPQRQDFLHLQYATLEKSVALLLQPLQNVEPYLAFCNNYSNITTNFTKVAKRNMLLATCFAMMQHINYFGLLQLYKKFFQYACYKWLKKKLNLLFLATAREIA